MCTSDLRTPSYHMQNILDLPARANPSSSRFTITTKPSEYAILTLPFEFLYLNAYGIPLQQSEGYRFDSITGSENFSEFKAKEACALVYGSFRTCSSNIIIFYENENIYLPGHTGQSSVPIHEEEAATYPRNHLEKQSNCGRA